MTKTVLLLVVLGAAACGGDDDAIDSNEEARRAYLGLDESIGKSITLGFAGFNAATNANIPPQMTTGLVGGTLVITGQVDQGVSMNKDMRLRVGMVGYTDGKVVLEGEDVEINLTYDTNADVTMQPYLQLQLRNIPNGTLGGSLMGTYVMSGDIEGEATLDLTITGAIMDDGTGKVVRVPGMTMVTGTAKSGDGTYEVNLTI